MPVIVFCVPIERVAWALTRTARRTGVVFFPGHQDEHGTTIAHQVFAGARTANGATTMVVFTGMVDEPGL